MGYTPSSQGLVVTRGRRRRRRRRSAARESFTRLIIGPRRRPVAAAAGTRPPSCKHRNALDLLYCSRIEPTDRPTHRRRPVPAAWRSRRIYGVRSLLVPGRETDGRRPSTRTTRIPTSRTRASRGESINDNVK